MTALPWHAPLQQSLRARIDGPGLPHALLLSGPHGWGEDRLAAWLALSLLGLDADREAASLAHPDLRWLVPDGAETKVAEVRELVEFAQGTAQAGPRKVAVLADAHCLNTAAANALLKTLEEPPAGTHLVLYSSQPGRLLPTIRSRCQIVPLHPDPAAARQWLEERVPGHDVEPLMLEHGGAPLAVLEAVERGEGPLAPVLEGMLESGAGAAGVQALLQAGTAAALGRWYRYVLALAAGEWRPRRLQGVARRAVVDFADELLWVRRQLLTSNSANERLLAERVVARWRHLARGDA